MATLSHLDDQGAARMVDVSAKDETVREAVAEGKIRASAAVIEAIRDGGMPKGDVLAAARLAGIMAAKQTGSLIPLCHPIPLDSASIELAVEPDGVRATATVRTSGKTGVEMEALTAVSVALLTLYDMAKALDKAMVIGPIRLLSKKGGASGDWQAP